MWYPTVRSSIMCLSKLYRSLDVRVHISKLASNVFCFLSQKRTFQGLSQEVLLACIDSLEVAYIQIKQRKTPLDAYLFIIKYLLIVREQITPFHIETSIREVYLDFTKTKCKSFMLSYKNFIKFLHFQPLYMSCCKSAPICSLWQTTTPCSSWCSM